MDLHKHWARHFENYDLFMNNYSAYRNTIDFHIAELKEQYCVLDDGCGTGNLTLKLVQERHLVRAIDPSPASIELTKSKCAFSAQTYSRNNLIAKIMFGENLEYQDNTFNGISSMFVIPFVSNTEKYVSEMYRVSRPGGKIVISAWPSASDLISSRLLSMVAELEQIGMLPKYQKEWNNFLKTSKINSDIIKASTNTSFLPNTLANAGFAEIKNHKNNPYKDNALFITCYKPA